MGGLLRAGVMMFVVCLLLLNTGCAGRPVAKGRHLVQTGKSDKAVDPAGAKNASTTAVSSNANTTARLMPGMLGAPVATSFKAAPPCLQLPTANTSAPDESARLWGWDDSQNISCAFKDSAGHAVWYPDYIPSDWLHTPICSMPPFPEDSVADSTLKVWGWELDGSICAFKDDQQEPMPLHQAFRTAMLSWEEAAACTEDPLPTANNSVADALDCLWGYQLQRNCAFRDKETGKPLLYPGYTKLCNTTASTLRAAQYDTVGHKINAAQFDAPFGIAEDRATQGKPPTKVTAAAVTPMPMPGQKSMEDFIQISEDADFANAPYSVNIKASPGVVQGTTALPASQKMDTPSVEPEAAFEGAPFSISAEDPYEGPLRRSSNTPGAHRRLDVVDVAEQVLNPRLPKGLTIAAAQAINPKFPKGVMPAQLVDPKFPKGVLASQVIDPKFPKGLPTAQAINPKFPKGNPTAQVVDPKFPKGQLVSQSQVACCSDVTPPSHGARGTTLGRACLPEAAACGSIQISEDVVTRPPAIIPASELAFDLTFPGKVGGGVGHRKQTQGMFKIAESSADINMDILPLGRFADSGVPQQVMRRRLMAPFDDVAVVAARSGPPGKDFKKGRKVSVATATAVSSGNGNATAISNSTDGGSANSTAIAADGHTTVANASAKGDCNVSVVVVNGTSSWHCAEDKTNTSSPAAGSGTPSSAPNSTIPSENATAPQAPVDTLRASWDSAGRCLDAPNKTNSVQDGVGRLWGYDAEQKSPCAYKAADGTSLVYEGYKQVVWQTAPACPGSPATSISMQDTQGRLWGWDTAQDETCAYKDPSSGEPIYLTPPSQLTNETQSDPAPQLAPSAAGPVVNGTVNSTADDVNTTDSQAKGKPQPDAQLLDPNYTYEDNSPVVRAAEERVQALTDNLGPHASREEVALTSAKAAIIYQMASDATLPKNGAPKDDALKSSAGVMKMAELSLSPNDAHLTVEVDPPVELLLRMLRRQILAAST